MSPCRIYLHAAVPLISLKLPTPSLSARVVNASCPLLSCFSHTDLRRCNRYINIYIPHTLLLHTVESRAIGDDDEDEAVFPTFTIRPLTNLEPHDELESLTPINDMVIYPLFLHFNTQPIASTPLVITLSTASDPHRTNTAKFELDFTLAHSRIPSLQLHH